MLTLENQGKLFHADERRARMSWWRAQATRYLLRWPSTYLCRLTNRERHLVYGKQVGCLWSAYLRLCSKLCCYDHVFVHGYVCIVESLNALKDFELSCARRRSNISLALVGAFEQVHCENG